MRGLSSFTSVATTRLHEGLWMLDDLDAARLVELASSVLRWASFHLDEDHDHLEACRVLPA